MSHEAKAFEREYKDGDFERFVPKKYQKKR